VETGRLEVRQLRSSEVARAVGVLARAFDADEIITLFLNEPGRRRLGYELFFRAMLGEHLRYGSVWTAILDGRIVAIAVWRPPDATGPKRVDRWRWAAANFGMRLLFPGRARTLLAGFSAAEQFHPREPHWYLFFVGVDPPYQGRGLGARLLRPVLDQADNEQRLCYLETPTRLNQPFYRRLGFELTAETRHSLMLRHCG
jgi:ribosomal protein S18 acetylase RimI-like enzyme